MPEFVHINLLDAIAAHKEDSIKEILNSYKCPLNPDVERFLRKQALEFAVQRISITFLLFKKSGDQNVLVGYFALTNKPVRLSESGLSNTFKKRISKFARYDAISNSYMFAMPLIAQLGKNYTEQALEFKINGWDILDGATEKVREAQTIIGGKTLYIECEDNAKLKEFYSENGFIEFGKKKKNNADVNTEQPYLIQMLKYIR